MTDPGRDRSIDELLDRAVRAVNSGDRATAEALAEKVLAVDQTNVDAEELLAAPSEYGELRRLTIMFADLVDSTALSTRIEPETYRTVVGRYRDEVLRIVNLYDGHIANTKGDGLLAVFGHPHAHEDDVQRAVQAGLDITRAVAHLSARVQRRFGFDISVRVGIHRGLVYLDTAQDDVYGFAANLAARMCSIAQPGTVAVSEAVERLVRQSFELEAGMPETVKGVDAQVVPYRLIAERETVESAADHPLVGRSRELDYLATSLGETAAQSPRTSGVAFCGDPGMGKSALARTAVEIARRSGDVVLQLFASPFHADVGLHPVRKLIERRCGIARSSAQHERLALLTGELRAQGLDPGNLVPYLAPVLGIPPSTGYDPAAAEGSRLSENIVRAIRDYLSACTRGTRGLVVAEDMHWFDASTTDVIGKLIDSGLDRVFVVMTSRTLSALPQSGRVQLFELSALSDEESDQLISMLHPAMPALARTAVRRRCDGVPLYIEEVVAKLKEQRSDAADSPKVPDTLYEALFARLRSSQTAVRVVEAAATIGSLFDGALLRAVLDMSAGDLDRLLTELHATNVLEPVGESAWRFRHELLREVASELAPPSIRRRLHGRVADALLEASSHDWPLIAAHFEQAHRYSDAVSAYQEASATARQRGGLEEARRYLSRALDQLAQLPAGPDRDSRELYLRLRHGFLAAAAEGPGSSQTAADFERCLQLCGTDQHPDELFATLMALFTYYVTRTDFPRAQQIVESLKFGVDAGREWWRAENIGGSATLAWFRGDFQDAWVQQEQADALLASRGSRDVEAEWFMPHDPVVLGLCNLALARWVRGDLDGAEEALQRSDSRATELPFPQGPFSACYLRYIDIWVCLESDRLDRAAELADDIADRADGHGFDQWTLIGATIGSYVVAARALAAGHSGAPEITAAIETLTAWVQACRLLRATIYVPSFDGLIARMFVASGRLAEARDRVTAGLDLARGTGMHYYDAELLRLRAATHDRHDDRDADLDAAFALAHTQRAAVFALRAALDAYAAGAPEATSKVAEAVAMYPADSSSPEFAQARTLLG